MLSINKEYCLEQTLLTNIDYRFIKISDEFSNTFPIKWNKYIDNIITNQSITFFRDTSAIIQITNLNLNEVEFLFTVLKAYLNSQVIEKIIYKKEFIIIHFNDKFHMELITNSFILYLIKFYRYLLNKSNLYKVYFCCKFTINNEVKIIPLVIKYNNIYYVFDDLPNYIINKQSDIEVVYLYKHKRRGFNDYKSLQILQSNNEMYSNFIKLLL